MTKEFLNENKLQFSYCTREQQHILLDAWLDGLLEHYDDVEKWSRVSEIVFCNTWILRTKPIKRLSIPWEHIKPEYRWAAIDEDMEPFAYVDEPKIISNVWSADKGKSLVVLNIDTSGISWRDSLVERPAEDKS